MATDDLDRFCCHNPGCRLHGQRGVGNLSVCGRFGKADHRRLSCNACEARFSASTGAPLFNSELPHDKVLAVLEHLADGGGIRQTARLVGVSKDTVTRLARLAGRQAQAAHDEWVAFAPLHPRGPVRWEVVVRGQGAEELRPRRPGRRSLRRLLG